jgi:hypothetical protein
VSAEEAGALRLLLAGRRLVNAIEALAATGADAAQVGEWFSRWSTCSMLAAAWRNTPPTVRGGGAETAAARRASERQTQRRRREPAAQQRRSR